MLINVKFRELILWQTHVLKLFVVLYYFLAVRIFNSLHMYTLRHAKFSSHRSLRWKLIILKT